MGVLHSPILFWYRVLTSRRTNGLRITIKENRNSFLDYTPYQPHAFNAIYAQCNIIL
jgi:hypothetical protein